MWSGKVVSVHTQSVQIDFNLIPEGRWRSKRFFRVFLLLRVACSDGPGNEKQVSDVNDREPASDESLTALKINQIGGWIDCWVTQTIIDKNNFGGSFHSMKDENNLDIDKRLRYTAWPSPTPFDLLNFIPKTKRSPRKTISAYVKGIFRSVHRAKI